MKRWTILTLCVAFLWTCVFSVGHAQNTPTQSNKTKAKVKPSTGTQVDDDAIEPGDDPPSATPKVKQGPLIQRKGAKVFLFMSPIQAPKGANSIGSVLLKMAMSRLNRLESIRLKNFQQMPNVPAVMQKYGDLEKLDRVSLIAIKNATGFDGLIRTKYNLTSKGIDLTLICIDFRNGKIFRKRRLQQPLGASLFQTLEQDMVAFAVHVRRSYRVTLRIQSNPTSAQVSINGAFVGVAPLIRELKTGTHSIEVSSQGYTTYRTTMFLKSGDTILLRAVLKKATVAFSITSEPSNSNVYLDGRKVGKTPMNGLLPVGSYQISIRKKGYTPYSASVSLKSGDRLQLHVPLYNPLANRFLNAKPSFRLDTRQIHVGFRYVYLGLDRPQMNDIYFIDFSFLMRMYSFEVGFRISPSVGISTSNPIDTFVGRGEGVQNYDVNLTQVHAIFKYVLFEKYSFAMVHIGTSMGLTFSNVVSGPDDKLFRLSFSINAFASLVSRLVRSRNFSLEVQFDLGFAYLGQILYNERKFNLFGRATEAQVDKPAFGPYGGFTLRFVFWNGIF